MVNSSETVNTSGVSTDDSLSRQCSELTSGTTQSDMVPSFPIRLPM